MFNPADAPEPQLVLSRKGFSALMTTFRTSCADRRLSRRFEPIQELWGTLEFAEQLPVRDLCEGGVGVKTARALRTGAVLAVQLGEGGNVHARVVHATAVDDRMNGLSYRLGLEFLNVSPGRSDTPPS